MDLDRDQSFSVHDGDAWVLSSNSLAIVARTAAGTEGRSTASGYRLFDLAFAGALLLVLLPVLLLIALLIAATSRGPIVFVQQRIGKGGKPFPCLKFRTMVVNAEEVLAELLSRSPGARAEWQADHKLRNDPRITSVGKILRKLSLDELPQLINIAAGQMSVVGPRPIVAAEIPRYGDDFRYYCAVRPGLTGLWQISGRNDVSYEERVKLDRTYVEQRSFSRDLGILARTVPAVMASRGCY